jgi:hypothetical protein
MGRGHLIRIVVITLAGLAAAATAAAATGVRWSVLDTGKTTPTGAYTATGYVAVTKAQEQRFAGRLSAKARGDLARVNLQNTGVVAVFLDGMPCSRNITVNSVTRAGTTATVSLHYARPPIGVAMCVRTNTPYVLIGVSRKTLGHPAPTHVRVAAVARA